MRTDYTYVLARIIGPILTVAGVMLIAHPGRMLAALTGYIINDALFMFAGFITLTLGLILITMHQRFDTITAGLISVFGWLMAARGLLLLLAPDLVRQAADFVQAEPRVLPVAGLVAALIGVWITYAGYIAGTLRVDHR